MVDYDRYPKINYLNMKHLVMYQTLLKNIQKDTQIIQNSLTQFHHIVLKDTATYGHRALDMGKWIVKCGAVAIEIFLPKMIISDKFT